MRDDDCSSAGLKLNDVRADRYPRNGKQNPIGAGSFHDDVREGLGFAGLHARLRVEPVHRRIESSGNDVDDAKQGESFAAADHVGFHDNKIGFVEPDFGLVMNFQRGRIGRTEERGGR